MEGVEAARVKVLKVVGAGGGAAAVGMIWARTEAESAMQACPKGALEGYRADEMAASAAMAKE